MFSKSNSRVHLLYRCYPPKVSLCMTDFFLSLCPHFGIQEFSNCDLILQFWECNVFLVFSGKFIASLVLSICWNMREHDHPATRNKHEISSLKIEDVHDLGTTYQQQQGGTYGPITNISCLHMRPPWSFLFCQTKCTFKNACLWLLYCSSKQMQ